MNKTNDTPIKDWRDIKVPPDFKLKSYPRWALDTLQRNKLLTLIFALAKSVANDLAEDIKLYPHRFMTSHKPWIPDDKLDEVVSALANTTMYIDSCIDN